MKLYMPRFWVAGFDENLANLRRCADEATGSGCEIVVFPEQLLSGYYGEYDLGVIKRTFAEVSAKHADALYIFGTICEDGFNRQYAYRAGEPLGYYDKIHLFRPNGEAGMWKVGGRYVAVEHKGLRIGMATCNDVRFPEQARKLKIELGINMLVYPALWPWQRDHVWSSLLRARAIENGAFCAGCCVAGVDNSKEHFDGAGNYAYGPIGDLIQPNGRVYELDLSLLEKVNVDTQAEYVDISKTELF